MFSFIKYRRVFYGFSICLVLASIVSILFFGLKLGIDFTGGTVFEVEFVDTIPDFNQIKEALVVNGLSDLTLQKSEGNVLVIKTKVFDESLRGEVLASLNKLGQIKDGSERFESIGSVIGNELKTKTNVVIFLSLFSILIYIALSFRKLKRPVKSYVYGIAGVTALFHDIIIPLGVFAWLGKFMGAEITIPIISALLTVFGYSINDTVVVFDRIRENLLKKSADEFGESIDKSINQTLARSFNTSFTVLLCLFVLFFLGDSALRDFSLVLLLGVGFGTYSSIFLASPLLFSWALVKSKRK